MGRLTEYRCDPELTEVLIGNSFEAGLWLRKHGVRFQPALGRQAFKVDGKFKFWGGLACHILGGGQHLVAALHENLERVGIPVLYDTTASALLRGDTSIEGVRVRHHFREYDLRAKSAVFACGGFESNPEMRTRYLGPNWDLAKVRGTKYNNGIGHRMAIDIGAAVAGHWSGAHAVQWDMNAPPYHAYGVTAGVTFTFGGLKATSSAEVEDITGVPIPGLYAAGEILGGLYFHNYGSGTGLVAGVVFGRIAGHQAAGFAARNT
jgi:tricarballylate dehydrogenase